MSMAAMGLVDWIRRSEGRMTTSHDDYCMSLPGGTRLSPCIFAENGYDGGLLTTSRRKSNSGILDCRNDDGHGLFTCRRIFSFVVNSALCVRAGELRVSLGADRSAISSREAARNA